MWSEESGVFVEIADLRIHSYQKGPQTEPTSSGCECSNHSSIVSRTATANTFSQKPSTDIRQF